ncbi:MAG TPA: TonB-dependent receptor [Candidatus Sulfotelmatobacter sp.]|nr:TonB-dependent receptor [Candidatus Sulfotelmatobacter sp.]
MRHLLGTLFIFVLLAASLSAQTFRGAINGTVTDPSGAVVTGASVRATNTGTGVTLNAVTTSSGEFSFQDLPLGTYKISVTASGFQPADFDNVSVTAGSAYTLPVKMRVGSSTTAVEVSAAALTLDTTSSSQDNTLPTETVQDVPMNGRDFTQLIAVQPGYSGYSVGGFGSLNGTRANQMNWQIDGVDNNDFWHNIPAVNQGGVSGIAGVVMPLDAIDEFASQSASAAEGGRNAGGIVNVVLKSGTNQIHGSAYYYNRNTSLGAATPFFDPAALQAAGLPSGKPPLRNENYGFSLGGPIVKDKTFWFITFEKQKYTIGLSGLNTEPSQPYFAEAAAILANTGNVYGSYAPVAQSTISQQMEANFWPSYISNLPAQTGNYFATNPSTGYSYNGVIKFDHNFTEKHHLSARWFGGQGSQTAPLGGSAALATASSNLSYYFEKAPLHVYNYAVTFNSALTPRMTNQILFGVNYFNQVFSDANNTFDTHSYGLYLSPDATIHGQPILGAPNVIISGFEQVGITPPEGRNDITGMLSDIVSYNFGKHQMRFGGEFRQGRVDEFYFRHSLGKFTFDGTQGPWASGAATCNAACLALDPNAVALADFLAGDVSQSSITVGNAERAVLVNGFNFFGQDTWQAAPRLTVNLGLRWDYFGPLHDGKKDLAVFIPGQGLVVQGSGINSIFPPDHKAVAPRLGFAYQPGASKDTVIRGSFGMHYDQINMNPFLDFRPPNNADGLEDNPAGISPVSVYALNNYTWQPNTYIFPGVQTCPTLNCLAQTTQAFDVFSVNQHFRTPYFLEYSLNIQEGLGNVAVWQVGYVGTQGRRLSIMQDINSDGHLDSQYPNIGAVNQLSSIGTSNYNALQTTLRLRSWHGVNASFAYTWGHTLDEISEYRGALADSATNLSIDYGNGDFDTRNNFSGVLTWDIPGSSHGPKWLSHGWAVNSLFTFHSGQPTDEVLLGLSRIGDPFAGVSHSFQKDVNGFTGEQWWNPASFCSPGVGSCPTGPFNGGNLARNQFAGPPFRDLDLSVTKNISITERVKAQFRVEMFNLFNYKNLASGVGAVGTSCNPNATTGVCQPGNGFGQVTDTIGDFNGAPGIGPGEAFNTQLALKIIF